MIQLFRSRHPSAYFALALLILLLWIPGFFKTDFFAFIQKGLLSENLQALLSSFPRLALVILAAGLICFEALYLNNVLNRHEVLYKDSFLPALIYVVLLSFNKDIISLHVVLLVNLGIIFLCDKIFSFFKNENVTASIFDCGFLIAIISMFYMPFAGMLIFLLIAMVVMRPFSLREWTVSLVGFILPYFFLAVYYFIVDSLKEKVSEFLTLGIFGLPSQFVISIFKNPDYLLFAVYLFLMLFFSVVRLSANFFKNSIKTRNTQQVMIFLSVVLLAESFFLQSATMFYYLQLAIPFSVFISYYYVTRKRRLWLYEVSFWVFIALIVYSYV